MKATCRVIRRYRRWSHSLKDARSRGEVAAGRRAPAGMRRVPHGGRGDRARSNSEEERAKRADTLRPPRSAWWRDRRRYPGR